MSSLPPEIVQEQIPEAVNRITSAGLGVTGFSVLWDWLGTNQAAITATCGIVGLALTAVGVGFTIYKSLKDQK
jgi:hypothetical protein